MTLGLMAGCGQKDSGAESENTAQSESGDGEYTASGDTIRFAMHPGNGAVAAYRAEKEGYFDDLGLDVEIVMFQDGVTINEGFAAGEVDIGINGFASAYSFATGEYAYLGDLNAQTEYGVYANPDHPAAQIQGEVEDLPEVYGDKDSVEGMKIAAPQGTIAQIVTDAYVVKVGLQPSDYELTGMDCGSALTALMAGEVDAAGLFPPYSTQALDAGYVRLASYEEVCGCVPADVFMATNEFLETHYDDTVLICQAIYKAAEELEADDEVYYEDAMAFFSENGRRKMAVNVRKAAGWQKVVCAAISIAAFLIIWFLGTSGTQLGEVIPTPFEVLVEFFRSFVEPIGRTTMLGHIGITFSRFLVGFLLADILGIALGLTMGWYPRVNAFFGPLFQIIRPIPILAWIPLGIIWFGLGETTKYFIVFLGAFMSVTQNSYAGAKAVDPVLVNAARMLGANDVKLFFTIVIPSSMPMIFAGLHTASAVGWASVVAAEMVRSESGIGWLIMAGQSNHDMLQTLVGIIGIAIIGFLLATFMRKVEEYLCRWTVRGK